MVDRLQWLEETIRQSERQIDLQLDGLAQLDDKLFRLIRLASLLLAGGLTLGGYVIRQAPETLGATWITFIVVLATSLALNLTAMIVLSLGYTGIFQSPSSGRVYFGPDPSSLQEFLPINEEDYGDFLEWILTGYSENTPGNRLMMKHKFRARQWGFGLLFTAVLGLSSTVAFIAWHNFNMS